MIPKMELKIVDNKQPRESYAKTRTNDCVEVVSIWDTIQGEGPFAGHPAVFVRLAGCNLQCPNCFGVDTKSRIPYLARSTGAKIRLDKVQEGEVVLTFDENLSLAETIIQSVLSRKVAEWIEIVIDNKVYDVTPEHPFFTTRGLVEASSLKVGDDILEVRAGELIAFKKMGDRNPMKNPEVAARSTANTDYQAMGKKVSATIVGKMESGMYTPTFHLLSPEEQEEVRRKQSLAKRRNKNPNWTGRNANWLDIQELIDNQEVQQQQCERCNKNNCRLLIHHSDGNHENDRPSNLMVWCHRCHNQEHQRGYNFWNGTRRDGKQLVKAHNGQKVQSVRRKKGTLTVRNVSCSPYPSFLANRMWVHNCDTDYTSRRVLMSPIHILDHVMILTSERMRTSRLAPLVVLTGGEPFRQNIAPLVNTLMKVGMNVQVETNGTIWNNDHDLIRPNNYGQFVIVCSPKTPLLSQRIVPHITHLKYVINADSIDSRDGLPMTTLGTDVGPVAKPWSNLPGRIFIQPEDSKDPEQNHKNQQAALLSCLKFGYVFCAQIHKMIGAE